MKKLLAVDSQNKLPPSMFSAKLQKKLITMKCISLFLHLLMIAPLFQLIEQHPSNQASTAKKQKWEKNRYNKAMKSTFIK